MIGSFKLGQSCLFSQLSSVAFRVASLRNRDKKKMFKPRAQTKCHFEGESTYWCVNEGAPDLKVRSCPGYRLTNAKSRWPLFTSRDFHVIAPLRNCSFGMLSPPMLCEFASYFKQGEWRSFRQGWSFGTLQTPHYQHQGPWVWLYHSCCVHFDTCTPTGESLVPKCAPFPLRKIILFHKHWIESTCIYSTYLA